MPKWTTDEMPDQNGRVAIVTGANSGLGYETTLALAGKDAHVIMACRNLEKGQAALEQVQQETPDAALELMALDLGSQSSIRAFAAAYLAQPRPPGPAHQQRRADGDPPLGDGGRFRDAAWRQPSGPLRAHRAAAAGPAANAGQPRWSR